MTGATPCPVLLLALALGLALVLGGCGGGGVEQPDPNERAALDEWDQDPGDAAGTREPTAKEQQVIDQLVHAAEHVRHLELAEPVRVEIHQREAIVRYLTTQMEDEDLAKSRDLYVALGLLPPDIDIRELLQRVLGEQVVGYYDDEADRLVVRDDVMHALTQRHEIGDAHVTLVHELVHALQDQRLGLGQRFHDDDADTDPAGAYHALVEGDATLAMIGFIYEGMGRQLSELTAHPEIIRENMANATPTSDMELGQAPPILRVTLVSSYLDGMLFVAALHQHGGWAAVDEAHRHPPDSEEQVLHPEKFFSRELPDPIAIPELPELAAAGLESLDEDSLGELETSVYLGQLAPDGVDARAGAGWSGDRLRVYRPRNGSPLGAVVWITTWDDENEAREAEVAAAAISVAVPPAVRPSYRVQRTGRAVLIIRNLEAELHPPVVRAFEAIARALPPAPAHGALSPAASTW